MMQYDVVVWRGVLSDGSICYAAVCPAVNHAHGQGDTEAEALSDVADAIALIPGASSPTISSKPARLLRTKRRS